jgi:hypothetical protein
MKTNEGKADEHKPVTDTPVRTGDEPIYTLELAIEICARLAEGRSLKSVCEDADMPSRQTVFRWLWADTENFKQKYYDAKEASAEAIAEEMFDIADDSGRDVIMTRGGREVVNREFTERSKLRIETRKWYLSKIKAKKYGDKLDLTNDGGAFPTPIYGGLSSNKKKKK